MRVWDIHPGYLNRESLLGEHREVHAVFSVILNCRQGYARHPETMRWRGCMGALVVRHAIIVQEMMLRGYHHHSPGPEVAMSPWPRVYINPPFEQFDVLERKYHGKLHGRIPLPRNTQQLWAQHKYSVLARDPELYKLIGPLAAKRKGEHSFRELSRTLVEALRTGPSRGGVMNALLHMWGYVSGLDPAHGLYPEAPAELIREIQRRSILHGVRYLQESTALSELACWV
jgi:hypothetical protein